MVNRLKLCNILRNQDSVFVVANVTSLLINNLRSKEVMVEMYRTSADNRKRLMQDVVGARFDTMFYVIEYNGCNKLQPQHL